jgi:hypothetical protein
MARKTKTAAAAATTTFAAGVHTTTSKQGNPFLVVSTGSRNAWLTPEMVAILLASGADMAAFVQAHGTAPVAKPTPKPVPTHNPAAREIDLALFETHKPKGWGLAKTWPDDTLARKADALRDTLKAKPTPKPAPAPSIVPVVSKSSPAPLRVESHPETARPTLVTLALGMNDAWYAIMSDGTARLATVAEVKAAA